MVRSDHGRPSSARHAQAREDHDELGQLVAGHRGGQVEDAEEGAGDEHGEHGEGERQVLAHDLAGPAGQVEGVGELGEVVGHEGDVRGLERGVAIRPSPSPRRRSRPRVRGRR